LVSSISGALVGLRLRISVNRSYTKTRPVWAQTLSQRCFLGGAGRRVVVGGRSRLKLIGASEFADALAVAVNTGAGGDEPAEISSLGGLRRAEFAAQA